MRLSPPEPLMLAPRPLRVSVRLTVSMYLIDGIAPVVRREYGRPVRHSTTGASEYPLKRYPSTPRSLHGVRAIAVPVTRCRISKFEAPYSSPKFVGSRISLLSAKVVEF